LRRSHGLAGVVRPLCLAIFSPTIVFALSPTTTTLTASPNPSNYGQTVTLTATVTSGATGKVTFYDGINFLGVATLTAAHATLTTGMLPSGSIMLRAYYSGDTTYAGGSSAALPHTVVPGLSLGFQPALKQTVSAPDYSVAIGDFNGDGTQDLVTANFESDNVSVFLGNGDGTFRAATTIALNSPNAVVVGDFNGDGRADLAVVNQYAATVSILLGNGNATFQPATTYSVGLYPWNIAVGDFNSDGKADLVVANRSSSNLSVLLGNGDGTFAPAVNYLTPASPTSVTIGDFNGDGNPDLMASTESGISVFMGKGDGTFAAAVDYSVGGCGPAVVHDFNGDGVADIAVAATSAFGKIYVFLGKGDGTFPAPLTVSLSDAFKPLAVEDFDGDGNADLAVADSLGLGILLGNGDGSFQPITHYSAGANSDNEVVAVGEFNGDGIADVVLIDWNTWDFFVFLGGAAPDLTIAVSRFGGLTQGQAGAAYNVTVSNPGVIPSAGTVRVAISLPLGFNLTSLAGSGWLCNSAALICTRADPLSVGASYPPITLRFTVSNSLTGTVTSTFSVSGGGDRNTANNQVSDTVLIRSATTTTFFSSPNPAVLGSAVTLTAAVTTGATGNVTFFDGVTPIGSAPLAAGQAVFITSLLPSGSPSLHATYDGDTNYGPSTSTAVTEPILAMQTNSLWSSHSYSVAAGAEWVVSGDFNGDGKPDLVSCGASGISVLLGKGDGTFAPAVSYTVADFCRSMVTADFNSDGKLDLAFVSSNGVDVLLGNGAGAFGTPIHLSPGVGLSSLAAADFNGDGIPDLVALSSVPTLFLGNGDGTFQPPVSIAVSGSGFSYLAAADLNGDGKSDLVVLAPSSGILGVLLGNGDGTFRPMATTSFVDNPTGILAVGDFNGDGKPDVAVVSWLEIQAFLGNGDGSFQSPVHSELMVACAYFAIAGDFNGDGKMDLAFTGFSGDSHIHLSFGNGDGTFQDALAVATDAVPGNIAPGDFNGDGVPDLAVSNFDTGTVNVLLGAQPSSLNISLSHEGNFTIGMTGSYTITVENPVPQNTNGAVTVTDTLPAGLTATAISGYGWSCTLSTLACTRSDALASGASYPVIVLAVSVASTLSPSTLANRASVSFKTTLNTASDPTTIVWPTATSLTVVPNPSTFGQIVTMTATVTAGATGEVTFSDSGTFLGAVQLSSGQASFSTRLLPAGRRTLSAGYAGNSTYAKSASTRQVQAVNATPAGGFSAPATYATGAGTYAVAVGDFNGDGKPDLITANSGANSVTVLLGNGDGTFAKLADFAVGQQPVAVAVGDFNNDGKSDIVAANSIGNSVSVLLGNGDGTFQTALNYPVNYTPISVVVGDFNGDGYADLAVAAVGTINLLFGNGDGTFRSSSTAIGTDAASNVIIGDFNNDGVADLAYAYQGYRLYVLPGNGDGTFRAGIYSSAASSSGVAAGDLDNDGKTDIVAPDFTGVDVYLGNGEGAFQPYVHYSTGTAPALVILADVNGDGKLDVIAVNNTSNTISVLIGNGDGTLQSPFTYAAGTNPRGAAAADFNGDGRTDLAVANSQSNNLSILLGTLGSVLSVTSSHAGLFAVGQVGAAYFIAVTNGGPNPTSGAVAVTDTPPTGFSATAISGAGWVCALSSLTCTRSDALAVGASYPAITVTVNVLLTSPAVVTNHVSISGGGAAPASGSDSTGVSTGTAITFQTNPSGLPFMIDGAAPQIAPQTINLVPGTHSVAVPATQSPSPGVQYVFTGWSDAGGASHTIAVGTSTATYSASFKTQYQLTTVAYPSPGGAVTPASGTYFDSGSGVMIAATPVPPYVFDFWNGDTSGAGNPTSITMNGPKSVTATFSVPGFTCDLNGDGATSVADVQLIINEALGVVPATHDLNHDGVATVADIQKVINAALGLGCPY